MTIHYPSWSKAYVKHRKADIGFARTLIREGKINRKTNILEVGSGTGNYCRLVKDLTGCQIIGIDSSLQMLKKAKQLHKAIQFKLGNALDIPFQDQSFDFVFYFDTIHHVRNLTKCFKEAYRVLKPKGKISIVTNSRRQIKRRLYNKYFPSVTGIDLERYHTILSLRKSLLSTGFSKTKAFHIIAHKRKRVDEAYYARIKSKSSSVLHYVPDDEFEQGLTKLRKDINKGLYRTIERTFVFAER